MLFMRSYFFVVLLAFSPTTMAAGIENKGQHCYMNALIQCLSNNQILINSLEEHNLRHVDTMGRLLDIH